MHNHTPDATPTILADIVRARRTHLPDIAHRIRNIPEPQPSTRSLYHNLKAGNAFIMECKSASPSLGLIRADYNPSTIAQIYSQYAAGISVLCEPERFGGDYDHLAAVAATTHLPVLCKDFIIDPIQIRAARHYGADAILRGRSPPVEPGHPHRSHHRDRGGAGHKPWGKHFRHQ